jgi:protein TonB
MNNTMSLYPVYRPKDPSRRYKGIAVVVVLHLFIGWAIVSGTARNALVALKKPLEAVVIQEVIIPPPPPPPPKEIKPPEAPKVDAPPPPFVPPPDVAPPATSNAPSITSVATPPPTPAVIAPPPPPVVAAPKPAPNRQDLRVACPTQVPPEMPRKAIQDGSEGVVRAQALVKNGAVHEVTILSGPRVFHAAVKAAMMQYKCTADATEILATQEFVFKIE